MYDLTRKGRSFIWGEGQQESFEEIKERLVRAPVLHMPNRQGRFAVGSALYHIQDGKPKLIAYASKRIPEAVRSYSITELELCSFAINISSFSHLLKKGRF